MIPPPKCEHCGKVAAFHDDFCTLCWSHRKKGKVLTDDQIAICQSQFAAEDGRKRWSAELSVWQSRVLIPIILMILWCAYWGLSKLPHYIKFKVGLPEMTLALLCAAGFAVGGFMLGGTKKLPVACSLLIIASLICVVHAGGSFLDDLNHIRPKIMGLLWSSIRLFLCGAILVSCVRVLLIKRPVP